MSILRIIAIILVIIVVILAILYFVGTRLQRKQAKATKTMQDTSMNISLLVLDKQKLHIKDAGFNKQVVNAIPAYLKWRKFPVIKARIIKANIAGGAAVMSFICDPKVYKLIPTKTEVKVSVSGIYITNLLSAKGIDLSKSNKKNGK